VLETDPACAGQAEILVLQMSGKAKAHSLFLTVEEQPGQAILAMNTGK